MLLLLVCWAAPSRADTLLILGDSLSASYGMNEDIGWVNLLRAKMPGHRIINAAVSGETSAGGLRRLPALLESGKPQVVFVELGANDGLRGFPVQQMKNNLTKIISLAKASGAKVLLSEVMVPPNYGPRYAKAFNQVFQTLAKEQDVPLVPFFMTAIAPHPELMQADGLHPNEAAQEQISNFMLPWLMPEPATATVVPGSRDG